MLKDRKRTKESIINHIIQDRREYISVIIVFLIGLVIGIICINNSRNEQKIEITAYVNNFINEIKDNSNIDNLKIMKSSMEKNLLTIFILWFVGLAVISMPLIYLTIAFRGFCLGYTISAIVATLKPWKGILFTMLGIFLQNMLFIPCMIGVGVSGIKLYKSIRQKHGKIKSEIFRHSFFSLFIIAIVFLSSIIEAYVSSTLLVQFIKYL